MIVTTTTRRQMIHWLWLWTLTAIAISFMRVIALGQSSGDTWLPDPWGAAVESVRDSRDSKSMWMPGPIGAAWFLETLSPSGPATEKVQRSGSLQMHRCGDFQKARWFRQPTLAFADSDTWKQVALGATLLRLESFDHESKHFEAARIHPFDNAPFDNAVAECFLGRAWQGRGRIDRFHFGAS